MALLTKSLPDGRQVFFLQEYEFDFAVHDIFSDDLAARGIDLPRDGVYFDVGANIGLFAMYLHGKCPGATIYAYEPIPNTFEALEKNMTSLSSSCHAIRMGLGASKSVAEFDYFPGVPGLSTMHPNVGERMVKGTKNMLFGGQSAPESSSVAAEEPEFVKELFRAEKVQSLIETFSRELAARGVDHVDLLKIDTEGSEKEVLAGIAPADWPKIRQLIVEVHLGKDETEVIARQLQDRGYRTSIDGHQYQQDAGIAVYHIYATRP